ncbi:hypothetical protein ABIB25_001244 [Nakamurella sp. UYEF19]|uniref:aa3-type cytochrome oxidase subunit CtaJ n=1 Tax=Nakamurella sp. UYEF19 TaxID=1756392 RepID=UPI00339ACAF6
MSIFETVAIYVAAPVALYGLTALLTMVPGRAKKRQKYSPGQQWEFPAQWWAGDRAIAPTDQALVVAGTEGGARGTW